MNRNKKNCSLLTYFSTPEICVQFPFEWCIRLAYTFSLIFDQSEACVEVWRHFWHLKILFLKTVLDFLPIGVLYWSIHPLLILANQRPVFHDDVILKKIRLHFWIQGPQITPKSNRKCYSSRLIQKEAIAVTLLHITLFLLNLFIVSHFVYFLFALFKRIDAVMCVDSASCQSRFGGSTVNA